METALATTENMMPTVHTSIFLDMERFANAQRVGQLLASSTLVPKQFQGSVANCVIALNLADRLRVDPFMMMQNMYVVGQKPGIEGKMIIALIEGSGLYSTLKFKFEGEGVTNKKVKRPDVCIAYATELKTGEVVEGPPVSWAMAEAEGWVSNQKWHTMPDLMFRYRAAAFFGRVNCPGALLGLRTVEEIEDIEMIQTGNGTYAAPSHATDTPFDVMQADEKEEILKQFEISIPTDTDADLLASFISRVGKVEKATDDDVKIAAMKNPTAFWKAFSQFQAKQTKAKPVEPEQETRFECPQGGYVTASICMTCEKREDDSGERCPAAPEI